MGTITTTHVSKLLAVTESEPPYPEREPYPERPLPTQFPIDQYLPLIKLWREECAAMDDDWRVFIRAWPYARSITTVPALQHGHLYRVEETGEVLLAGRGDVVRGRGSGWPALILEGYTIIDLGEAHGSWA